MEDEDEYEPDYYDDDDVYEDDDYYEEDPEDHVCECCSDCCRERGNHPAGADNQERVIQNYSYKPEPLFFHSEHEQSGQAKPLTPYLGMELEISIDSIREGAKKLLSQAPELIYCKEDGSVSGFEMVTHPMSLAAAKSVLPFDTLTELKEQFSASGEKNGIHVHVSRSGFSSDSHVFRWMKLIYRNPERVSHIARRYSSRWASFTNEMRAEQKHFAEVEKGTRSRQSRAYTERYSAINIENHHTFEVRVFRGSLDQNEILAALELVAGSVEYTRQLTSYDIAQRQGWEWDSFITWASEQGETYANLIELDSREDEQQIKAGQDTARAMIDYAQEIVRRKQELIERQQREERLRIEQAAQIAELGEYWEQAVAEEIRHHNYSDYEVTSPAYRRRDRVINRARRMQEQAEAARIDAEISDAIKDLANRTYDELVDQIIETYRTNGRDWEAERWEDYQREDSRADNVIKIARLLYRESQGEDVDTCPRSLTSIITGNGFLPHNYSESLEMIWQEIARAEIAARRQIALERSGR